MVHLDGIAPPTPCASNMRSTTELQVDNKSYTAVVPRALAHPRGLNKFTNTPLRRIG